MLTEKTRLAIFWFSLARFLLFRVNFCQAGRRSRPQTKYPAVIKDEFQVQCRLPHVVPTKGYRKIPVLTIVNRQLAQCGYGNTEQRLCASAAIRQREKRENELLRDGAAWS